MALLAARALGALVPVATARAKSRATRRTTGPSCARLKPARAGLKLTTAGGDRYLVLSNGSGKTTVVTGYDDDPYLRFLPNRVVEVNLHSPVQVRERGPVRHPPAAGERHARRDAEVESGLDERLLQVVRPPHPLDGQEAAPAGQGQGKRTKIFDWEVPLQVDGTPVTLAGTLLVGPGLVFGRLHGPDRRISSGQWSRSS